MNYERRRSERGGIKYKSINNIVNVIKCSTINTRSIQKLKPIPRYVENRIRENKINVVSMELLLRLANIKSSIQFTIIYLYYVIKIKTNL